MEDKYKVLLTVIDEGSLSGAAEKLGYTPSGISRIIVSLENEVGIKLLHRSKNGVLPTDECNTILPSIQNILFYNNQCEQLVAGIKGLDEGTLTIGTSYGAYYQWLAQVIAEFIAEYPNIDVRFIHKNSTELSNAIESHRVDVGIVSERDSRCNWIHLCDDPLVAWVPEGSEYEKSGYVPIEAFMNDVYIEPYAGEETDNARYFKRHQITPNIRHTVNDTYAAFCLVEAGLGITVMNHLTKGTWSGHVSELPVVPEENISIGIITAQDSISPVAKKFISYIKKKVYESGIYQTENK